MKYHFNYSDQNYKDAVNYDGTNYYNCPVTVELFGKKYILSLGTSDAKSIRAKGEYFYLVGENSSLDYISLTVINVTDGSVQEAYLSGNDINDPDAYSYDILSKETDEQIKILSEYL